MLIATLRSNANNFYPYEAPSYSASHPDPSHLTRKLHIYRIRSKSEHLKNEADENLVDKKIRCMIRVKLFYCSFLQETTDTTIEDMPPPVGESTVLGDDPDRPVAEMIDETVLGDDPDRPVAEMIDETMENRVSW